MEFTTLTIEHLSAARALAAENYREEREFVPSLPADAEIPELAYFANNGLGVAALSEGKLVGFIGVYEPWAGAYDMYDGLGTFSPLHAHGAVKENRGRIYQDMYQYLSSNLAEKKIVGLGLALYAHDCAAKEALFEYGFGMRCKDRIRLVEDGPEIRNKELTFGQLTPEELPLIRKYRYELDQHLKSAPCFMQSTNEEYEAWLKKVEAEEGRRTFVARRDGEIIAFLDVTAYGENFASSHSGVRNIHGAYCDPAFRGHGVYSDLVAYVNGVLKEEGITYFGVDHESYNPTANRFWAKYFQEYTNSVVRKIEQWSVGL